MEDSSRMDIFSMLKSIVAATHVGCEDLQITSWLSSVQRVEFMQIACLQSNCLVPSTLIFWIASPSETSRTRFDGFPLVDLTQLGRSIRICKSESGSMSGRLPAIQPTS